MPLLRKPIRSKWKTDPRLVCCSGSKRAKVPAPSLQVYPQSDQLHLKREHKILWVNNMQRITCMKEHGTITLVFSFWFGSVSSYTVRWKVQKVFTYQEHLFSRTEPDMLRLVH